MFKVDAAKLWGDFLTCSESLWSGLSKAQRKESVRECLQFGK